MTIHHDAHKLQILLPKLMIQQIDAWRAQQPGVPNRSEAVRRLLAAILEPKPKR